jgi:hypothetical protein
MSPTPEPFRLEEATIDELHAAIRAGEITCVQIVQHYIARARAYNGVASALVTADGAPVAAATGTVRAGAPLRFPTETVKAATLFPDLDDYKGTPLEYGRMESTASDPSVQQQYGMIVGIPDAGQVGALATLNIRGERSVTCRGEFDRHPSQGPLPPGAPPACEIFRHYPDALERAAELDATFGRNPDLDAMPMYGVVFSFKDPFDTKDMRSTGGGARSRAGRAAARQGRHHLREGREHGVQRAGRQPRGTPPAGRRAAVDPRLPAQQLGRQSVEPLRHDARGIGQHEPRHGEPRRGDARLDARPSQPQRGRADPAAQGDARLQRRGHRRRHLL